MFRFPLLVLVKIGFANLDKAMESMGSPDDMKGNVFVQVEALHGYGISVPAWSENGNNVRKLLKAAKRQAQVVAGMFGFYMDGPVNRIGTSGWEAVKGNILAGIGIKD